MVDLISNNGSLYSDLVKYFFANFSIASDYVLTSRVKNIEIVLSLEDLENCPNVPFKGQKILHGYVLECSEYNEMDNYISILRMTQEEIQSKQNTSSSRFIFSASNLTVSDRMLHFIIAYILVPKHSNHSQIGDTEMQFLYSIKKGIRINWAYTILFHMQHQQRLSGGIPYARLITKIMNFYEVDLKREP